MSTSVYSSIHPRAGQDADVRPVSRPERWGYECGKRALDLLGSVSLLVALFPVFALIAAGVRWSSPGPVFFRQVRLGRDGRRFWCYKFRTMVPDAESRLAACEALQGRFLDNYKIDDDPRVTRFGAFLRRTSLDELPQL